MREFLNFNSRLSSKVRQTIEKVERRLLLRAHILSYGEIEPNEATEEEEDVAAAFKSIADSIEFSTTALALRSPSIGEELEVLIERAKETRAVAAMRTIIAPEIKNLKASINTLLRILRKYSKHDSSPRPSYRPLYVLRSIIVANLEASTQDYLDELNFWFPNQERTFKLKSITGCNNIWPLPQPVNAPRRLESERSKPSQLYGIYRPTQSDFETINWAENGELWMSRLDGPKPTMMGKTMYEHSNILPGTQCPKVNARLVLRVCDGSSQ